MRTLDFTPLHRFAVGFDHMQRQLEDAMRNVDAGAQTYPPYNVESRSEDDYRVTLAVAGFSEEDLDITLTGNTLVVSGRITDKETEENTTFLHRGIAARAFERRFELADHIQVTGAGLANGLLSIDLRREIPEEKKPRAIKIMAGDTGAKAIANKAA